MKYTEESHLVRPNIGLLNRYAQKAKQVAITSINPVFSGAEAESKRRELQALRIQVEGPQKSLSYFHRLIEGANLTYKA
jgi:hypothetical protein